MQDHCPPAGHHLHPGARAAGDRRRCHHSCRRHLDQGRRRMAERQGPRPRSPARGRMPDPRRHHTCEAGRSRPRRSVWHAWCSAPMSARNWIAAGYLAPFRAILAPSCWRRSLAGSQPRRRLQSPAILEDDHLIKTASPAMSSSTSSKHLRRTHRDRVLCHRPARRRACRAADPRRWHIGGIDRRHHVIGSAT